MGALSGRPEQFLGIHFSNPVHVLKPAEVVPGLRTSQGALSGGVNFVKEVKRVPIVVKDCPGFLVNRILLPYVARGFLAAQEGAASPEEIDRRWY